MRVARELNPPNPIFHHPALHLLNSREQTPATFKQIHSHFITTGLALHTYPVSRLLLLLSSLLPPSLSYAAAVLLRFPRPTTFLFNILISSTAPRRRLRRALSLYSRLLLPGATTPNAHTFPSLLSACSSHPIWAPHGRALHTHLIKFLSAGAHDRFIHASLLTFYSRRGSLATCSRLFDRISNPDLPIWNSILSAYARCSTDASLSMEPLILFKRLQLSLTHPNEITLVALIGSCGDLGALSQGVWAHAYIRRNNLAMNHYVGTALIGMYSKCGRLDLAHQMFASLPHKDTLCYNAMIRGFSLHGQGRQAVGLFRRMWSEGLGADDVTLVVVMCAHAHAGLVDEGRRCFDSMEDVFGIEPKLKHYGCLVDLFCRAGQLEEAEEVVRSMPMKPNAVLYRYLIVACRIHGNLEIVERVIAHLIQLEPEHSGNYVLLSNMYANINRWDDVRRVRKVMKDRGINKSPGSSLVEMDGAIHEFVIGDKSHQQSLEIYAMLDEIGRRLHECGHRPSMKEVMFNIEEEDKEDALSYHSERLAIAFALVASDSSAPIRVIKNLIVCSDCHSSTKLVSWIYGREIIVRDRTRFHHFKDGICSCLDYW